MNVRAITASFFALLILAALGFPAALASTACGIQPPPWGEIVVAPGQAINIGLATDADSELPGSIATGLAQRLAAEASAIHGHAVELVPVSMHCQATAAAEILPPVEELRTLAGLLGPPCSRACVYAEGLLYDMRTTMIAPGCTASAVVEQGFPVVFRLAWNDRDQGTIAAEYAAGPLAVKQAVVVHDSSVFARSLSTAFTQAMRSRGLPVASPARSIDIGAAGSIDGDSLVRSIRSAGGDGIFLAVDRPDVMELYARLRREFPTTPLVSADTILADSLCLADPAIDRADPGSGTPASRCPAVATPGKGYVSAGVTRHNSGWLSELDAGGGPTLFIDQQVDAVRIYAAALAKVGRSRSDGSLIVPRQGLRDAIARARLNGLSGRIDFDASGERRHDVGVAIYEIGDHEAVMVRRKYH